MTFAYLLTYLLMIYDVMGHDFSLESFYYLYIYRNYFRLCDSISIENDARLMLCTYCIVTANKLGTISKWLWFFVCVHYNTLPFLLNTIKMNIYMY